MEGAREGRVEVAFFGVCFGRSGCFFFRFFCRSCFWNGFDGAVLRIGRQVVFKIGLDDGDLGTVNDLDAGTAFDDADGAGSFQGCVIYQAGIGNGAAQTCGAGVDRGDVLAAAEGPGVIVWLMVSLEALPSAPPLPAASWALTSAFV